MLGSIWPAIASATPITQRPARAAVLAPAHALVAPTAVHRVLLGAATLVVSKGSAAALGVTDSSKWSVIEWATDVAPRTLYGLAVAYVVEQLDHGSSGDPAADLT